MSRRIAASLSTLGLSALLATTLGACVIEGPPDGFFDEGEGGYGASEAIDEGGAGVVGDPVSTSGIYDENRDEWVAPRDPDDDEDSFADGLAEADPGRS